MPATPETSDRPVVTRFAPSPTGALHIGGARTALFAWAYARKHDGKFILRIEDTDRKRSSPESTKGIIRDLMWLGLNWDEGPKGPCMKSGCGCGKGPNEDFDPDGRQIGDAGPYFQSQRAKQGLYDKYIDLLLEAGEAYEDGGAVRLKMGTHRGGIAFDDAVYGHIEVPAADLEDFVIRKGEDGGKLPTFHFAVVIDDALMGVTHVIRGQEHLTNTSKHAAIYDALAKVTGDAQTWTRPVWVHTPSIMNPGGSKMSKRDKAKVARAASEEWLAVEDHTTDQLNELLCIRKLKQIEFDESSFVDLLNTRLCNVEFQLDGIKTSFSNEPIEGYSSGLLAAMRPILDRFMSKESDSTVVARDLSEVLGISLPEIEVNDFRKSGYLPGVALNYVALLGWNPGGDVERFDLDFLTEHFSLDRIGKSNSTFDREKLFRFSADTMVGLPPEAFQSLLKAHLDTYHPEYAAITADDALFARFCEAYQPRTRTLSEPAALAQFLIVEDGDITYDFAPKPIRKAMTGNEGQGLRLLAEMRDAFAALPEDGFGTAAHDLMNKLAEDTGINMGKYAQPVRVAVSGGVVTPPLDLTLDLLGKDRALARIENCLNSEAAQQATS